MNDTITALKIKVEDLIAKEGKLKTEHRSAVTATERAIDELAQAMQHGEANDGDALHEGSET